MSYKFVVTNRSEIPATGDVVEADTFPEAAAKAFPGYELVAARNGIPGDFSVGRVIRAKYGKRFMSMWYIIGAEKKEGR